MLFYFFVKYTFVSYLFFFFFFFNDTATTEIYTLSLHDALPICRRPTEPAYHLGTGWRFQGLPLPPGSFELDDRRSTLGNLMRDDEGSRLGGHASDILIQAMGAQPEVNVVMTFARVEPFDVVLLCSDGLYKVVSDEEILQILGLDAPLRSRAENLIQLANAKGGPDNITVILAEIEPPSEINAQA